MSKRLSIYFAVMGTLLLALSAGSFSFRNTWLSVTLIIVAILHIGLGFVIKARLRKRL